MTASNVTFVLGGARSGKSLFAEQRVEASSKNKIYIATAEPWDNEMRDRISVHKSRRDADWTTVDAPLKLTDALVANVRETAIVLVDCLTLWLNNLIMAGQNLEDATTDLTNTLRTRSGPVVVVSNEVGLGIVPENALARSFRDAQGRLNQQIAHVADDVFLLAAGLPMTLKTSTPS